ncbi:MAG TPA: hypothetical protein VMW89_13615, partial [Desulfatiglandales bacterium]|nr:hypothetical protein [Desulfatiglandales bacterium]
MDELRIALIHRIFQSQFIIKSKHSIEHHRAALNGDLEPLIAELSDQMTGAEIQLGQAKVR